MGNRFRTDRNEKDWVAMLKDVGGWDNSLHSINAGAVKEMAIEIETLRQFKADIEEQHRLIMSEKCAPDEHHCTCVPVLRDKLNRSNAKLLKMIELYIVPDDYDHEDKEKWINKYLANNGLSYLEIKINKSIDS